LKKVRIFTNDLLMAFTFIENVDSYKKKFLFYNIYNIIKYVITIHNTLSKDQNAQVNTKYEDYC